MSSNQVTNQPKNPNERFEVFFDGGCPLCKREISMIAKMDVSGVIRLTDICDENFTNSDRSMETLMKEIHGRLPNGEYVVGVEVFRQIYSRIGFNRSVGFTRWPVVRNLLDIGYRFFAWFRFHHAKRRMGGKFSCDAACALDTEPRVKEIK